MDSKLYEELCHRFIAQKFGVPLDSISSPRVPNPKRPNLPEYKHQIDLYWEVENDIAHYLHIANAKWRGSGRIDQDDVMLLQHVRQKLAAHKALLIGSVEFTSGAIAAAKDEGIGLHVVRPSFDCASFPTQDRAVMQAALAAVTGELYSHVIIHRGLDLPSRPAPPAPSTRPAAEHTTRQLTGDRTREGPGSGATNRSLGGPPSGPRGNPFGGGGHERPGFTRGGGGIDRR
jgi:hypothetical protein